MKLDKHILKLMLLTIHSKTTSLPISICHLLRKYSKRIYPSDQTAYVELLKDTELRTYFSLEDFKLLKEVQKLL